MQFICMKQTENMKTLTV